MEATSTTGAAKPSVLTPLFTDRRVGPMLVLGFSSGLPLLLVYGTQSAWLTEAKVPLATIGLLSELTLAYKFKFLWAPFLDRYDPPVLGAWLGRRRGWIVATQLLVVGMLAGIAFGDPANWLWWTIGFSFALGFAGATQDVVLDGYRIAVASNAEQPLMTFWYEIGWRVGNLVGGAGALYLADAVGWKWAYLCMAICMAPALIAALLAPEPETDAAHHGKPNEPLTIWTTIVNPIKELLTRLGPLAVPILIMIALFRMPGYISTAMAVPLFKHQGFSNTDIATVTKLFGFWLGLGGTFLSSWLINRAGMMPSLLIGTVAGSAAHLALAYLAAHGGDGGAAFWTFAISVGIDLFAYAFASIVLITYMSTLAASEHAASQYALMTSLVALPGSILAGFSGFVIDHTGFVWFFVGTALIGIPAAILCVWLWRHGAIAVAGHGGGVGH